jgi:hypothetical protein
MNSILNPALFDLGFLDVLVFFSAGNGPAPPPLRSFIAPCPSSTRWGICCRLDWAMRVFLERDHTWFVRAIDDGWFNPYNLQLLIRQLESFVDPRSHVVIKSHDCPRFYKNWNVAFMQGGSPTLMSRAAIEHSISLFYPVCSHRNFPADDLALTLIANRSFASRSYWGDVRFTDANNFNPRAPFRLDWQLHQPTQFRYFHRKCPPGARELKPLKVLVGVHTRGGILPWRELAEQVSLSWFPDHLLLEFLRTGNYVICANRSLATYLSSREYLQSVTPLLHLHDPYLNFSSRQLVDWGFRHIPNFPWLPRRPYGLGVRPGR